MCFGNLYKFVLCTDLMSSIFIMARSSNSIDLRPAKDSSVYCLEDWIHPRRNVETVVTEDVSREPCCSRS